MGVYNLSPDEFVILEKSAAKDGFNDWVALALTNQNLIEVLYSWRGAHKDTKKYPLLDLREKDGKPNVILAKTQLRMFFDGYDRQYTFETPRECKVWHDAIVKAYKERLAVLIKLQKQEAREERRATAVYTSVFNKLDSAKGALLSRKAGPIERKCPRCGAELSGMKGEEVECPYCQSVIILK